MTEEIWRPVVGYEGLYEVSSYGRVRSLDRYDSRNQFREGKILKNRDNGNGYLLCGLSKNGIVKNKYIHRLVAEAFIERPDGLYEVNHKDENKKNNIVDNLEWCDRKYNNNYGTKIEREITTKIKKGIYLGLSQEEYKIHKKEYQHQYYQENKDRIFERLKEYQHQYYLKNKDRICEQQKEYYRKRKAGL